MSLEENESGSELLTEDQMFSDLETDSEWIDPSPSSPSSTPQCSTSASISALPTSSSSVPLPVTTMSSVSFTASSTTTSSGHTYASALSVPLSSGASTSVALPVSSAASTSVSTSAVSSLLQPACAPLSVPVQGSGQSSNPLSVPVTSAQTVTSATAPSQKYPKLSRYEERNMLKEELSLVGQTKVICSLDLLLDLFKRCQHPGCIKDAVIKKKYLNGPTVVIKWSCCMGHKGTFSSSRDLNDIYSNNLQLAASIMVSGNNFAKVEKMANFLGLSFISDSTFYRMQRLYFIPAIDEWWSWQREQLVQEFLDKPVIVCGDGQCDSAGHTAKNLCYFLMELVSGYILEVEVRDKRHVGLTSANMEKQALQNALQRLQTSLNVVEVVTDASTSIKKLLGKNSNITLLCFVCNSKINNDSFKWIDLQFKGLVKGGEHDDAAFKKHKEVYFILLPPCRKLLIFNQ